MSTSLQSSIPLSLLVLLLVSPITALATNEDTGPSMKYTVGFDYSRGGYDLEEDTEVYFIPVSAEANFDSFRVKLTVPFLSIDGPSAIAVDADGNETGLISKSTGGLGQVSARAGYFIPPFHELAPWLELTGKLSAPTESKDSLGSGEWAFSLHVDAFKRYGRVTPFARFGRTFYSGSRLNDRLSSSVGASFRLTDHLSTGLSHDWSEASVSDAKDAHDLVIFASVKLGKLWSIGPYGSIGFTNGGPDYGVGYSISFRPSGN